MLPLKTADVNNNSPLAEKVQEKNISTLTYHTSISRGAGGEGLMQAPQTRHVFNLQQHHLVADRNRLRKPSTYRRRYAVLTDENRLLTDGIGHSPKEIGYMPRETKSGSYRQKSGTYRRRYVVSSSLNLARTAEPPSAAPASPASPPCFALPRLVPLALPVPHNAYTECNQRKACITSNANKAHN